MTKQNGSDPASGNERNTDSLLRGKWLGLLVALLAVVSLISATALTVYAIQQHNSINNRINNNSSGIQKLNAGQCASTGQFYDLINKLLLDTSQSFNGGPVKRIEFINKIFIAERKTLPKLKRQNCTLKIVIPQNLTKGT